MSPNRRTDTFLLPGLFLLLSMFFGVTCSVRIRLFDVPEVVKSGHDVVLNCDYDLQRQRLYMVKWYKGTHEFYRYSPHEKKAFVVENLNVDISRSNDHMVVLQNLHVDMTGKYTCEVSTEDIFETDRATEAMTVVALPRGGPHIQGYDPSSPAAAAVIGDTLMLNCTSLKSKPAAKLAFFINDVEVTRNSRWVRLHRYLIMNEEEDPQTESAILSMEVNIRRRLVKNGKMTIRCEASIANIYQNEREIQIFVNTHTAANYNSNPEGNQNSNGGSIKFLSRLLLLMLPATIRASL